MIYSYVFASRFLVLDIKINGTNQIVSLLHMLLAFGEYSGIGIKCALGMGAVAIEERSTGKNGQK